MEFMECDCGFRPPLTAEQLFEADIPERLINDDCVSVRDEYLIPDEVKWMSKELEPLFGPVSEEDIFSFLWLHLTKWDIPYIAMYRKDDIHIHSLLKDPVQPEEEKSAMKWYRILWAIRELHTKWMRVQVQKMELEDRFREESERGLTRDETPQLFESIIKALEAAETEKEVEDVYNRFDLFMSKGEGQIIDDMGSDPDVRKYVRRNYFDFAMVSVSSIKPGLYMDFQRKPLNRFEDAQWLFVQKAEEENLVQVSIKLPEECLNKLISDLSNYYLSNSALLWNEQRKLILQDVVSNFILPSMEKEARSLLVSRAKNWLLMECGKALWNRVSMAPPYEQNQTAPPRVMACCWGPGEPATTLVMLDSCGELLDMLCLGPLSWENLTWTIPLFDEASKPRVYSDQKRILKFVSDHQPDIAIIGAANMSCPLLREQLLWVSDTMVRKSKGRGRPLRIVYGDESLARLYENSDISLDQLPGLSGIAKRAVALGRYLQNPLAMVATLCGAGREILSWKLLNSPAENFLNPDEKYAVIEQIMIDVTNQVGVDVNLAINHEWLFAPMQFISGLGPQMAESLKKSLVKSGKVSSRNEFATLHGLGERVYTNAVGFFRVRRSGTLAASSSSSQFIALLDETRIHPYLYPWAEQMAQDVYGDMDALVQSIRNLPSYMEKLDIEEYARSKRLSYMMQTLCFIREGLVQGFKDWRKPYHGLSENDKFYMLTGETPDTLSEGCTVQAIVRRVLPKTTICTVGAGLICSLSTEQFEAKRGILNVGDTIICKIKVLRKKQWDVELETL